MKKRWKVAAVGLGGAILAGATAFQLTRKTVEERPYEKIARHDDLEIRRYAPRVVARTVVEAGDERADNEGFRRLSGYIFGGNAGGRSIDMTTPVERSREGTKIAMTTPVERTAAEEGWVVSFTMPAEYTLDELPTPNDSRVTLRELPAETVAVLRFRGSVDEPTRRERIDELLRLVREHGYETIREPSLARFDPPWVLPVLRRNEVQVAVRGPARELR